MGDSKQPARKTPLRVERRKLEVSLDEGFLCEILRCRAVSSLPEHSSDEADDRPLIPPDYSFEGSLRSSQGFGDEPGLCDRLEIDRDGPRSSLLELTQSRAAALQPLFWGLCRSLFASQRKSRIEAGDAGSWTGGGEHCYSGDRHADKTEGQRIERGNLVQERA
jgi:hypothetical protein